MNSYRIICSILLVSIFMMGTNTQMLYWKYLNI